MKDSTQAGHQNNQGRSDGDIFDNVAISFDGGLEIQDASAIKTDEDMIEFLEENIAQLETGGIQLTRIYRN